MAALANTARNTFIAMTAKSEEIAVGKEHGEAEQNRDDSEGGGVPT